MSTLHLILALAVFVALGHSILSERLHLRPMRQRAATRPKQNKTFIRLSTMMYHFPSVLWVVLAVSLLLLDPNGTGTPAILLLFGSVYALSGFGNFWATGRIHPGGVLLLAVSGLVFYVMAAGPSLTAA